MSTFTLNFGKNAQETTLYSNELVPCKGGRGGGFKGGGRSFRSSSRVSSKATSVSKKSALVTKKATPKVKNTPSVPSKKKDAPEMVKTQQPAMVAPQAPPPQTVVVKEGGSSGFMPFVTGALVGNALSDHAQAAPAPAPQPAAEAAKKEEEKKDEKKKDKKAASPAVGAEVKKTSYLQYTVGVDSNQLPVRKVDPVAVGTWSALGVILVLAIYVCRRDNKKKNDDE